MAFSFLPRVIVFCHNVSKYGNGVGGKHEKQEWPASNRRRQDGSRHKSLRKKNLFLCALASKQSSRLDGKRIDIEF